MQLQILDFILLGIMAVSGLLAMARGFTREMLSLLAWALAAVAAYYASQDPKLIEWGMKYVESKTVSQVGIAAGAALIVLVVVSLVGVRISDRVVDSAVGSVDRTIGLFFGLTRGLILVALAYLLYGWSVPLEKQEVWVKKAVTYPFINGVRNVLVDLMPPEVAANFSNNAGVEGSTGGEATEAAPDAGYTDDATKGLDDLTKDSDKSSLSN